MELPAVLETSSLSEEMVMTELGWVEVEGDSLSVIGTYVFPCIVDAPELGRRSKSRL